MKKKITTKHIQKTNMLLILKGIRKMTTNLSLKYEPKGSKKKDRLFMMERRSRENWEKERIYEADAPKEYTLPKEKYFTTFPFPYMNGRLHLGHAFSATKNEFKCRYMRLLDKNTLWPFAFHCTGMPITSSAYKLKNEMANPSLPKKQWGILSSMGIPDSDIPSFSDPAHWLKYFPPRAYSDLKEFGVCVDWRRSFLTTDINPYYDSFIKWQFELLKERNKLSYGKRHTVFCTVDNQPCTDHDRQTGEGIMPQEYTLIKMRVLEPFPPVLKEFDKENLFVVAATMRPETMYGQTNCFVLPEGEYGAFRMKSGDIYLCSEHCAKNMAYQEMLPEKGKYQAIKKFKGVDIIGVALKTPLTKYEKVHTLPMLTISMKKGTGFVTSCPSDAPDDYAALRDLQTKKGERSKWGIKEEWVMGYNPIPIIETPTYGDLTAVALCESLKIKSHRDTIKLKQAKEQAYLQGYNEGVMKVGICKGVKVSAIKNQVKDLLIKQGWAVEYYKIFNN